MWSWLGQINPNVVITIVSALVMFVYHKLTPPPAQSAIDRAVEAVRAVLVSAVTQETKGKTPAEIETMLRGFAAVQLAKLGYVAGKYPPLLQAAVDAAVHEAITLYVQK